MSRTLFWYIFKDLVRIFMMASGALAGIMSFGGLLRPLTEHGLDGAQVARMLTYFMPAMSTYSLPVAALFATTMVYGRLAADNELTACRAGGMSFWFIGLPAFVLGLIVAILSLLLLCFVVPVFSLKIEQVIYSNVAKLMANQIERKHELRFGAVTVFAQEAILPKPDMVKNGEQVVLLVGPTIVTYETAGDSADPKLKIPQEFYMARTAQVNIHPQSAAGVADDVEAEVLLSGGTKFPRDFKGSLQAGVDVTTFGPVSLPPLIRENVKFMDIRQLRDVALDPGKSQRVREAVAGMIKVDQQRQFLQDMADELDSPPHACVLRTGGEEGETFIITRGPVEPYKKSGDLIIDSVVPSVRNTNANSSPSSTSASTTDPPVANVASGAGAGDGMARDMRLVTLQRLRNGSESLRAQARQVRLKVTPRGADQTLGVSIELYDAITEAGGETEAEATPRATFQQSAVMPMPADVAALSTRQLRDYVSNPNVSREQQNQLRREEYVVSNAVRSELHCRASFAVSCLILVVVGCALGMMFRSGNFLSAFAVSFVPALLCIALIVSGQQTAEHVPYDVMHAFHNPLALGIGLIWAGNVVVLGIAVYLISKLVKM